MSVRDKPDKLALYKERLTYVVERLCAGDDAATVRAAAVLELGIKQRQAQALWKDARWVLRHRVIWDEPQSMRQLAQDFYGLFEAARDAGDVKGATTALAQYRSTMVEHGGDKAYTVEDVVASLVSLLEKHAHELSLDHLELLTDSIRVARFRKHAPSKKDGRRRVMEDVAREMSSSLAPAQ